MQERFLTVYGKHVVNGEKYVASDDTCDQRSPVNDPQELYNMFMVPEDIMDELDAETLQDFDNDDYDYDDRTDYGVDVAAASQLDLRKSLDKLKNKKAKEKKPENLDAVNPVEDDAPEE